MSFLNCAINNTPVFVSEVVINKKMPLSPEGVGTEAKTLCYLLREVGVIERESGTLMESLTLVNTYSTKYANS